jgi:hypothetical protein
MLDELTTRKLRFHHPDLACEVEVPGIGILRNPVIDEDA